jgi:hypothetical protein
MRTLFLSAFLFCSLNLLFGQPDLKIENVRFEIEPPVGGLGMPFSTMYITVKNDGNKPAIGTRESPTNGYMLDIILSSDNLAPIRFAPVVSAGRYPEDHLLVGGRISNTNTIKPGQTFTYKQAGLSILKSVDMSNPCGIGKFNLGFVVDPGNKVVERNESNNTFFKEFKLICR